MMIELDIYNDLLDLWMMDFNRIDFILYLIFGLLTVMFCIKSFMNCSIETNVYLIGNSCIGLEYKCYSFSTTEPREEKFVF